MEGKRLNEFINVSKIPLSLTSLPPPVLWGTGLRQMGSTDRFQKERGGGEGREITGQATLTPFFNRKRTHDSDMNCIVILMQ